MSFGYCSHRGGPVKASSSSKWLAVSVAVVNGSNISG